MNALVLDASTALEWFFPSPDVRESSDALAKRELANDAPLVVPHIWRFEILNFLSRQRRLGKLSEGESVAIATDLLALPLAIVGEGDPATVLALAADQSLTAYDASYLSAALQGNWALLTFDRNLGMAAERMGVTLA